MEVVEMGLTDDTNALSDLQLPSLKDGEFAFRSRVIHFDDGVPIQYEDRHVNPRLFPDYLDQDFTRETPNAYLARYAPVLHGEYRILARMPTDSTRRLLEVEIGEPCLAFRCLACARAVS